MEGALGFSTSAREWRGSHPDGADVPIFSHLCLIVNHDGRYPRFVAMSQYLPSTRLTQRRLATTDTHNREDSEFRILERRNGGGFVQVAKGAGDEKRGGHILEPYADAGQ